MYLFILQLFLSFHKFSFKKLDLNIWKSKYEALYVWTKCCSQGLCLHRMARCGAQTVSSVTALCAALALASWVWSRASMKAWPWLKQNCRASSKKQGLLVSIWLPSSAMLSPTSSPPWLWVSVSITRTRSSAPCWISCLTGWRLASAHPFCWSMSFPGSTTCPAAFSKSCGVQKSTSRPSWRRSSWGTGPHWIRRIPGIS